MSHAFKSLRRKLEGKYLCAFCGLRFLSSRLRVKHTKRCGK